jgi:hypothetical protein
MGWGALAREVHVHAVPSGHNTIVTRHIDVIAAHVQAVLAGRSATAMPAGPRKTA